MKKIVIDIDGVLLDLHTTLETHLKMSGYANFSMSRVLTYDFNRILARENKLPDFLVSTADSNSDACYLNAPRGLILDMLGSLWLFEVSNFYEGVFDRIKLLCQSKDFDVIINTLSFSYDIAECKRKRVVDFLKGYSYSFLSAVNTPKEVIENADYVLEDSLEELSAYVKNEKCEKLLISHEYNQKEYNSDNYDFTHFKVMNSTVEALDYILKNGG